MLRGIKSAKSSLALDYLGVSKELGVALSAVLIMAAAGTGNFRRFERFSMVLVFGSLLLVPLSIAIHPPVAQIAHDFVTPLAARHFWS